MLSQDYLARYREGSNVPDDRKTVFQPYLLDGKAAKHMLILKLKTKILLFRVEKSLLYNGEQTP